MPSAQSDNVGGHRMKYENLKAHYPAEDVGRLYVGGLDPLWIGYLELECVKRYRTLADAVVVDIGCGIGRLTRHMLHEPIRAYLGFDIIPEIMQEAVDLAAGDSQFSFRIAENCKIPLADKAADMVIAFSVITHLLDEEAFEYFAEARRVLDAGGVAMFTYFDFMLPGHADQFFGHAAQHRHGHGDLLRFTTKEVLDLFAGRAGFASATFVDAFVEIPTSGAPSALIAAEKLPPSISIAQSMCVLTI
jgi:SAM-dependent methyltransferase